MRVIHDHGYESTTERCEYISRIHQNIVATIYTVDHAMELLNIKYKTPQLKTQIVENILKSNTNYEFVNCWKERFELELFTQQTAHIGCLQLYQSIVQIINQLANSHLSLLSQFWNDCGVQCCLRRRNEYNLMDSSMYYMSRLEEILSDNYIPTVQDILRVRIPTNGLFQISFLIKNFFNLVFRLGINEYTFGLESINFLIVDVGGQRTERRKWIHCFENVTSIIFIVALSEFDQNLSEPIFSTPMYLNWRAGGTSPVNRLEESKALFKTIVTSEWFHNSSVILFLNKLDLFEEKILYGPNLLKDVFIDYGDNERDPTLAAEFIMNMFYKMEPNLFRKRVIYSHFTCATDTKNIKLVFQAVKETILEQMLCKEIQIF